MRHETSELLSELIEQTRSNLNAAEELKVLTDYELNWKIDPNSWSMLECIEHLNRYGKFYIPAIQNAIKESTTKSKKQFKSGLLGNYFAMSMIPKENLNKMKTFKEMNPLNSKLDRDVIDIFIQQQVDIMDLLSKARNVSLEKIRIEISISKWIRLKLGDTFRFLIYHNIRHMRQIEKVKNDFAHYSREVSQY